MSKYTTQLRWVVEEAQGNIPYSEYTRYTPYTYKKLGLSEYPIFEESYRQILNDKIIDHFFFREIGFETVAQFQWYMRRTMQEIMPMFNELYIAHAKIDDPLNNLSRSWKESWDTNIDGSSEETANNRNVYQDTPMSLLDNTTTPTVQGLDYATNVTYDDNVVGVENSNHNYGWRVHDEVGRNKSQAELMKEYLDMFVNIDVKVIEELETLFMGLW